MTTRGRRALFPAVSFLLAGAVAAGAVPAPGGGLCEASARGGSALVAIFSAFPAELAPLVARATIRERVDVSGRPFYLGELAGLRVVMGITGIGQVNAIATATNVLDRYEVAGVVFSGVSGTTRRIGDVLVPTRWLEVDTGTIFAPNPALLELACGVQQRGGLDFQRCLPNPPPDGALLCLPHRPLLLVGGLGTTSDPYLGRPFPCDALPGFPDVFGCELPEASAAVRVEATADAPEEISVAVDQETAAVGRVATARGIPWIAVRSASDGNGDPLHLTEPFAQFFIYYPLAAHNAGASALAVLDRLGTLADGARRHRSICRLLAHGRWTPAARLLRVRKRLAG